MKLAFNGEARYPDYSGGYDLYIRRARSKECVDNDTYKRIIRSYCRLLSDRLYSDGLVDIPELGSVATALIDRKPHYRGKVFLGFGSMDWKTGKYNGEYQAFGVVFLPDRRMSSNLRSFGFVTNRNLFKRMKKKYLSGEYDWVPIYYTEEMI